MDYEHPFVQEVRANPHDVAPRLIYADYLEEAGDPQAELIRVQVELSQLPAGDPARRDLELRETELLAEYADEWLAPLRALGAQGLSQRSLQRGLIERVRIDVKSLLEHGEELCRQAPALYHLGLRTSGNDLLALAEASLPAQITALDLSSNRLSATNVAQLAGAAWCRQLQQLSLAFNRLGDDAMGQLGAGNWSALTRLNLNVNNIGRAGAAALVQKPSMPKLESLAINSNPLELAGIEALASSYLGNTLRELDVGACGITSLHRILVSPLGQRLESLVVRGNQLRDVSEAIQQLERAPRLRYLDMRGTYSRSTQYGYGSAETAVPTSLRERLGDGFLW